MPFPNPAIRSRMTIPDWMRARFSDGQRFLLWCLFVGLLCGLAAVGFHWGIHSLFTTLWNFASKLPTPWFATVMIVAPSFGGLIVGISVKKYAREAAGSGIPQTKSAYYNHGGHISGASGIWRWLLGMIYIGLGNSLGREGPTVHFSSAIASRTARWAFRDPERQRAMIPVGMAAGIAAAFNAPLSALTFVFEELLDNFSMRALGGMVVAVVVAAAVSRTILGEDPILQAHLATHYATSLWMLVCLPLGILAGLLSQLFLTALIGLRSRLKSPGGILPAWSHPAIGGALCGMLGMTAYWMTLELGDPQHSIFSIGYESVESAFAGSMTFRVILILLVLKLIAVVITYGTGGSGGLFSPTLYLGAMLGAIVGLATVSAQHHHLTIPGFPTDEKVIGGCVLLGMGAMFAATIRCPFTSLIIIFEMTGSYSLILPLMAGNMLAWSIARRLRPISIYNALLLQDGISLRHLPAYRGPQDYHNLPVKAIMTYDVESARAGETCGDFLNRVKAASERPYRCFPVCDDNNELIGLAMRNRIEMAPPETPISELADEFLALGPDTSIRDAAQKMLASDRRQGLIVSELAPRKLLGYLTLNDIARQQNASQV